MKMYFFDPCTYSDHFTVMAESPQAALGAVKSTLGTDKHWKNATLEKLPQEYKIREYEEGEVSIGEYS